MKALALMISVSCAILGSGCGSSGGDDAMKFVGTWKYDSGMVNGSCLGMMFPRNLTGDNLTLTAGTTSDILLSASSTCVVNFKVDGNKANAVAAQVCNLTVAPIGDVQIKIDSWTLQTSDGMTMTANQTGSAMVMYMGLGPFPCTVTGDGNLTKQPAI